MKRLVHILVPIMSSAEIIFKRIFRRLNTACELFNHFLTIPIHVPGRITNSPIADVFIIWAKSDDADNRIRGFILERGMEGLTTPVIEGKFSLRASVTGQISMDSVEVPVDNLLPNVIGLAVCISCLR